MIPTNPQNIHAGANRPQPTPPVYYDLAAMLKANPNLCRVIEIFRADIRYLKLTLIARAAFEFTQSNFVAQIDCISAVDYSVRPPNPAILMGGPLIEFHEQHPLLAEVSQTLPNSDGLQIYDPPIKFGVLQLDQTYVIAGQFAVRFEYGDPIGFDEQTRQRQKAEFQQRVDWMQPFRLKQLKQFTTRFLG
jgi:hypothetical protein